jgi:hypothetical protein
MSIVTLEFDNTLEKSEIVMPLISSSKDEAGDDYMNTATDKAQTAVFGIQVPLIMINNTIIDFDAIQYFNLKSVGRLPEVVLTVLDRYELINNIDKPSLDNEVRIQLLPKFDDAYKKIDLTFYISGIQTIGQVIRITGTYKSTKLMSSQFKSYGNIDTYSLFKQIATETQLGFATNIAQGNDTRYAYCDNKSLYDLMDSEILYANATDHIMDWWIDLWDNINLVDVKERYNSVDSNEDMQIWVAGQVNETNAGVDVIPSQVTATITNFPGVNMTELFVKDYIINTKPGINLSSGSDRVFAVYEDIKFEHFDHFVQDGDVKNDIFAKYEYVGENYGEYNYMISKCLRDSFLQKINSETITTVLQSPLLALMRGHKVNFIRYVNDDMLESKMKALEDVGVIDRNIETNISLSEYEIDGKSANGSFRIDKTCSGQYLITGVDIIYNNNAWDYKLTLAKPASSKVSIIKTE